MPDPSSGKGGSLYQMVHLYSYFLPGINYQHRSNKQYFYKPN